MKNIKIIDSDVDSRITNKDIEKMVNSTISMYGTTGEDIEVIVDNYLLNNVIDVFGINSDIKKYDDNHFVLRVNKDVNSFKRYVLRNLEYIKVIKPVSLKEDILKIIREWE